MPRVLYALTQLAIHCQACCLPLATADVLDFSSSLLFSSHMPAKSWFQMWSKALMPSVLSQCAWQRWLQLVRCYGHNSFYVHVLCSRLSKAGLKMTLLRSISSIAFVRFTRTGVERKVELALWIRPQESHDHWLSFAFVIRPTRQVGLFIYLFFYHFNEAKKAESKLTYTSKVITVNMSAKWFQEIGWTFTAYLSWCFVPY